MTGRDQQDHRPNGGRAQTAYHHRGRPGVLRQILKKIQLTTIIHIHYTY